MDAEQAINPTPTDVAPAAEVAEDTAPTTTTESEVTEPVETAPTVEEEEVEYEGAKYKIPKPLKSALLMQSDYTRKTQELAEQRKALDAERVQHATMQREYVKDQGKLAIFDEQLEQYAKFDWNAAYARDAAQAAQWNTQWNILREQRNALAQRIDAREQERVTLTQQETAKQAQDMTAYLAKEFPKFNTDLDQKLGNIAVKAGLKQEQATKLVLNNPPLLKLLDWARIGQELIEKQRKAAATPPTPPAEPVPQVGASRSPPTNVLSDKLSPDNWMKVRNKQAARR